jgi:hypothetical protein
MTKIRSKLAHLIGGKVRKLSCAQGRYMLDHPDKAVRCSLAARADLDCEMLYLAMTRSAVRYCSDPPSTQ